MTAFQEKIMKRDLQQIAREEEAFAKTVNHDDKKAMKRYKRQAGLRKWLKMRKSIVYMQFRELYGFQLKKHGTVAE